MLIHSDHKLKFKNCYSKINDLIDKEPSILVSSSAFDLIH